jgi:hypothetical protein
MSQNSPFQTFSTFNGNLSNRDFSTSNEIIAKFAFLLLIIFMFIILLRIGVSLISFIFKPSESPRLLDGMVNANQAIIFPQDPNSNGAVTIFRSVNASEGIEFTWSVWIYIDKIVYDGQFHNIFYKGNNSLDSNGLNTPINSPGLYLTPNKNELLIKMNTFNVINEEIKVPDIPMNKWVNIILRCRNSTLDVYINGTITRSVELSGVPRQNYGDVYVASNGGFDGYISNLWYYNYALGTSAINKLSNDGPNLKMVGSSGGMQLKKPDYLSLRWYFAGAGDMFNPT